LLETDGAITPREQSGSSAPPLDDNVAAKPHLLASPDGAADPPSARQLHMFM
jgi:hypothetical protein